MPLTSSELTRRRKALTNDFDRRNNQWLGANTGPTSTAFEARMVSEATGAKIASARSTEGGAWTSIPLTALQDLCSSAGSNPTLSDLVKATNIDSMIAQGPAAGINVVQLSGGGIAAYCNGGTFLGAVDAAGNPISLPSTPDQNASWFSIIDSAGASDTIRALAKDVYDNRYVVGTILQNQSTTVNDGTINGPVSHVPTITITTTATVAYFIIKYNNIGIVQWASKIDLPSGLVGTINMVADDFNIYICSACNSTASFYDAVQSGTPSNVGISLSLATTQNIFIAKYDGSTGQVLWVTPVTSTGTYTPSINVPYFSIKNGIIIYSNIFNTNLNFYDAIDRTTILQPTIITYTTPATNQSHTAIQTLNTNTGAIIFTTKTELLTPSVAGSVGGLSSAIDNSGNIYIAYSLTRNIVIYNANGRSAPSGSTTFTRPNISINLCIVKYNSVGSFIWASSIVGGSSITTIRPLMADSNGNILFVFSSPGITVVQLYDSANNNSGIATTSGSGSFATIIASFNNSGIPISIAKLVNSSTNANLIRNAFIDNTDIIWLCGAYTNDMTIYNWFGSFQTSGISLSYYGNGTRDNSFVIGLYSDNNTLIPVKVTKITSDVDVNTIIYATQGAESVGSIAGRTVFYKLSNNDPTEVEFTYNASSKTDFGGFITKLLN